MNSILLPEWRKFYKLFSVWFMTLLTIIPIVESQWGYFSDVIPSEHHPYVFAVFGLAGVISRFINQSS